MSQGKAPKAYLLEEAKRTHKNVFSYSKEKICECGDSKNLHTWDYADNVSKVEGCQKCACKRFQLQDKGVKA